MPQFQQNLGDGFETDKQLTMVVGGDTGYLNPRGDEEQLHAAHRRKQALNQGQQDMFLDPACQDCGASPFVNINGSGYCPPCYRAGEE